MAKKPIADMNFSNFICQRGQQIDYTSANSNGALLNQQI